MVRVGYGPAEVINTGWYAPALDGVNRISSRFMCAPFARGDDLSRFDLIVAIKDFRCVRRRRLMSDRQKAILLVADNRRFLSEEPGFPPLHLADGVISQNPLVTAYCRDRGVAHVAEITATIPTTIVKCDYAAHQPFRIVWDGFVQNSDRIARIARIIGEIGRELPLRLVYFTDRRPPNMEPCAEWLRWDVATWDQTLCDADVAIECRPSDDARVQRKPPTKIQNYMRLGLPIVCQPNPADRQILQHGRTGLIAENPRQWRHSLLEMIADAALRESLGGAAREYVAANLTVEQAARKYAAFFDEVWHAPADRVARRKRGRRARRHESNR